LEKVEVVGGSKDEVMDPVKSTMSTKVETELLEATGC